MVAKNFFVEYLKGLFPDAQCELNFNNIFELLIAVILSAQCTDKRVNLVCEQLFKQLKTPQDFVRVNIQELEQMIKPCGFYHNKAKSIKECCNSLVNKFNGEVPQKYEDLLTLAGVGRKTANVVSSIAFGNNCIAVDTHVLRVANRLGFTKSLNPNTCEKDLTKKFKTNLKDLHHTMVLFGRYYCKAKKPECVNCKLKENCNYYKKSREEKCF